MRAKRTAQTSLFDPASVDHRVAEELEWASAWLDAHPELLDEVAADLGAETGASRGRHGLTCETILRCAVLKHLRQETCRGLEFTLRDSRSAQRFARVDAARLPRKSALQATMGAVRATRGWKPGSGYASTAREQLGGARLTSVRFRWRISDPARFPRSHGDCLMPQDDSRIPALGKEAFDCPHATCRAYAHQIWHSLRAVGIPDGYEVPATLGLGTEEIRPATISPYPAVPASREVIGWSLAECSRCGTASLWLAYELIWPAQSIAPAPNADLPEDAMRDYMEAASIMELSPRAAAALLRLALQRLCQTLSNEENLNDAIAKLVETGLDPLIQRALDTVRVIGNHAVHPGQMALQDDRETVQLLFSLVNVIVEQTISRRLAIETIYAKLPEKDRKAISKRDKDRS